MRGQVFHADPEDHLMAPTTRPRRKAGRPPKIEGTAHRWWLYCSREDRDAAQDRADREGLDLGDVMRGFLTAYGSGLLAAPATSSSTERSA
jgi:hypothetical protein